MKRQLSLIALVLVVILLAGCSARSTDTSATTAGSYGSSSSPASSRTESSTPSRTDSASSSPASSAAPVPAPDAPAAPSASAAAAPAPAEFSSASSASSAEAGGTVPAPGYEAPSGVTEHSDEAEYPADSLYSDDSDWSVPGQEPFTVHPGLLTAAEWNDNKNYDFILGLVQTNYDWRDFEQRWLVNITKRVQVTVFDGDKPIVNAKVELLDENENAVFTAQTDNNGIAYLFNNLMSGDNNQIAYIRASTTISETKAFDQYTMNYEFQLQDTQQTKSLDLMLVIDTTGSMSDELEFLKSELDAVIKQVSADNANIPVRLSINVYRDIGDDYVVRSMPFEENIGNQLMFLNGQYANGGGDFEEAVELALGDALENHDWNKEATARIMLLVLDAPPHNTPQIRDEMHRLTAIAAEQGIRIIPVASSGIDKNTEFLLRFMSMATGGSYVFLTDDSGIGGSHLEPTIGPYQVELLNNLLVRLLNEYLK